MSNARGVTIWSPSVDGAWSRIFAALSSGVDRLTPLRLSVRGRGTDWGLPGTGVQSALDAWLESVGLAKVGTVANTIFPQSLWSYTGHDRTRLFETYLSDLRWIKGQALANRGGTYFSRMIAPLPGKEAGQLEYVISTYLRNRGIGRSPVAMRLQAGIFDTRRDNVGARPGFPCLQQVSFAVNEGTLSVNGFYATQQVLSKAYGNHLGLARLGLFMAHEMGLELRTVEILVGIAHMERKGSSRSAEFGALKSVVATTLAADTRGDMLED